MPRQAASDTWLHILNVLGKLELKKYKKNKGTERSDSHLNNVPMALALGGWEIILK